MKREEVLLLLIFLLFVQGYLFRNVFPALLAALILLYLIYLRVEFSPAIESERQIARKLKDAERVKTKLRLRNLSNKRWGIAIFELLPPGFKAETPALILVGGEAREVEYFITPVRGIFKLRDPTIRATDTRGLFYTDFLPNSESKKEVEVYPNLDKIREESKAGETLQFTEAYKALFGIRTVELDTLREFQPGDEQRHIDWKATTRLGELIVKEFLKETKGDVYIVLDAGKEMRKGIKSSKIDFATTLTLQLAYALRKSRLGLMVYDDYRIKRIVAAKTKGSEHVERIAGSLNIGTIPTTLMGLKLSLPEKGIRIKEESRAFIGKILPVVKGRRSSATSLIEAVSSLPSSAILIFIADITTNTSELIKVLLELRKGHKILLLSPNPILFYDAESPDKETLIWLYERYKEREEIIKKLNGIVPTFDLGYSDLLETIRGGFG
ncbi:MAG: DUF58 domain-containing protein [Halobacteriota archaeon]|jgi:uncharacterized protein (DUF58 family)